MAITLWLTDRSRYEAGIGRCQRLRYLSNHAGPHGYGWQRKAQSMPAVTGTLIHDPITEGILKYLRTHHELPSDLIIHAAILKAQNAYRAQVDARGLLHTTDPTELLLRVNEQCTLLEGLVWAWVRASLEDFHATWEVVLVEEEFVSVLGCTCGLGDRIGTAEEHDARECLGLGWMTRGDAICRRRETGTYAYHDFKSTGMISDNWKATWDHRVQVMAGVMGAEEKLSATIDEVYIWALYKGRNEREWDSDTGKASGPKYQNTPLCYGYYRPANPPISEEQWAPKKTYVDDQGKNRRLGKDFQRVGVWAMDPGVWKEHGGLSPSHYWTGWIAPTGVLADTVQLIGPIFRSEWKLQQFQRQLLAEEDRIRAGMWRLYELAQTGMDWASAEFQALLDVEFPQARGEACQNAFGDRCGMLPICDRAQGWEMPEGIGYIARRPHHSPEMAQAISRGLLPPDEGAAEEGEE